jgi:F-type H+-transporting ATPase subunit delta
MRSTNIVKKVSMLEDSKNGIMRGLMEGGTATVDSDSVTKITAYLEKRLNKKIILDYKQNVNLTAGYRMTVEDLQIDASLEHQLFKLKELVLDN